MPRRERPFQSSLPPQTLILSAPWARHVVVAVVAGVCVLGNPSQVANNRERVVKLGLEKISPIFQFARMLMTHPSRWKQGPVIGAKFQ